MATPSVGWVVLVPFPFSDLSASKLSPALLMAAAGRGDWVCAQITSNQYADPLSTAVADADFQSGSLQRTSDIRPDKLFTAHESIFVRQAGLLSTARTVEALRAVAALFTLPISA